MGYFFLDSLAMRFFFFFGCIVGVNIAVGCFEAIIDYVYRSYFEGMRVRNVFLQCYFQVLFLLKLRKIGVF